MARRALATAATRAASALLLLAVASASAQAPQGEAFGAIYIPRINRAWVVGLCPVVERQHDTSSLGDGVCHLEGTATIAHDRYRIALGGHTPGAFDDLMYMQLGDQIVVWDALRVEVYSVTFITVTHVWDTQWLMPTDDETLTLITCSGEDRLIIHAERTQ